MNAMKPILLNTDMVRAILDNRKTVTRRVVKPQPEKRPIPIPDGKYWLGCFAGDDVCHSIKPPYRPGDILYVRETWRIWRAHRYDADAHIEFKAGGEGTVIRFPYGCTDFANRDDYDRFIHKWGVGENEWHPSIHMPREAARIFLRVTDVWVERMQEITPEQLRAEGMYLFCTPSECKSMMNRFGAVGDFMRKKAEYAAIWDSTIKPADRALYGCEANPWVWVIEFERISREEAFANG